MRRLEHRAHSVSDLAPTWEPCTLAERLVRQHKNRVRSLGNLCADPSTVRTCCVIWCQRKNRAHRVPEMSSTGPLLDRLMEFSCEESLGPQVNLFKFTCYDCKPSLCCRVFGLVTSDEPTFDKSGCALCLPSCPWVSFARSGVPLVFSRAIPYSFAVNHSMAGSSAPQLEGQAPCLNTSTFVTFVHCVRKLVLRQAAREAVHSVTSVGYSARSKVHSQLCTRDTLF